MQSLIPSSLFSVHSLSMNLLKCDQSLSAQRKNVIFLLLNMVTWLKINGETKLRQYYLDQRLVS